MTERGETPFRIRDLLGHVGNGLGLPSAVETGRVWAEWSEIVGPSVAAHAEPSSLKGGVLRVRADSPAWATEIDYLRDKIKSAVNEKVSIELVREVRVWAGPADGKRAQRPATGGAHQSGDSSAGEGHDSSPGRSESPPQLRDRTSDPTTALERARAAWLRHTENRR
jgi:hypothetical protein